MGIRVDLARPVTDTEDDPTCEVIGNISWASWNRLQSALWTWCVNNRIPPTSAAVALCDHVTNDPEALTPDFCEDLYYELSFLLDVDINNFTDFEHAVLDSLRRAARIAVARSWSLVLA